MHIVVCDIGALCCLGGGRQEIAVAVRSQKLLITAPPRMDTSTGPMHLLQGHIRQNKSALYSIYISLN